MDPLPAALLRRELGWSRHTRPFDYTKILTSLHARPEDQVTATIRASVINNNDVLDLGEEMDPVYNMDYSSGNYSNMVGIGYESGLVTVIDTSLTKNYIRAVYKCHESAIFSLSWSALKPRQLVTGSGDQNVRIWDCTSDFKMIRQFKGHSRTVKKVVFHPSQPDIIASASRDGAIRIWDMRSRNERAENYITFAHSQLPNKRLKITIETEVPVTDLLFHDETTLISCGSHDGFIKFWDLRKTYKQLRRKEPVRTISFPLKDRACVGFSSMCLDKMNNLYAASASKEIFKFNLSAETGDPIFTYENNEKMEFDTKMSLSSCGRYLGSGSRSEFAPIWDTWNESTEQPFMFLETEASVVTFSPADPLQILTGGDDGKVLIWRADVERSYQRKNTLVDKYKPSKSSILPSTYLRMDEKIPLHPKYRKSSTSESSNPCAFDLTSLLTDLPNAVIDGNYSNTRMVAKLVPTPKRRPSILSMIQSSPTSTVMQPTKRPSPRSSKSSTTPKAKRRKSMQSESPSSMQPTIVSFLQPFSQTAL